MIGYFVDEEYKKYQQSGVVGITPSMSLNFKYEPILLANKQYSDVFSEHHLLYEGFKHKESYPLNILKEYVKIATDILNSSGINDGGTYNVNIWNNIRMCGWTTPTVITLSKKE